MNSWNSQDGAKSDVELQQQRHNSKYFNIDGPTRLTSALQVVTNALASAEQQQQFQYDKQQQEQEELEQDYKDDEQHYEQHEQHSEQQNSTYNIPTLAGQTVVATDSDVSNGFVKSGRSLPYVFEANELGKLIILA